MNDTDLKALKRQFLRARKVYYNGQGGTPLMTDAAFDKLEDRIKAADPTWKHLHKTGTKVEDKKTEVPLVHFMPSLDKMYEDQVPKFYARKAVANIVRWIWMDKLDGTSLQLVYDCGMPNRLITRGDGIRGGDVSFLLEALIKHGRIPKLISSDEKVVFRLEALMPISVFKANWSRAAKGENGFDNIRNCVNGLFNRKAAHPALADVDMVVLGVYGMELAEGLKQAYEWGFKIVRHNVIKIAPGPETHTQLLAKRREASVYEMDGLVIAPARFPLKYASADKPKGIIAFKFNDEESAPEVPILDIIYEKTRLKRWSGVAQIPPTEMDGVIVERVTVHNAAWMKENGIGPGAIVKVLRSGGVIPKIVGVVKRAQFKEPPGAYEQRGRFLYVLESDKATDVRVIHFFMTTLGIEFLAEKTIEKLYDAGFTSIDSYVKAVATGAYMQEISTTPGLTITTDGDRNFIETMRKFRAAGIGEKQTLKILNELVRVLQSTINLKTLMVASGTFDAGMGERKLAQIEAHGISMRELCNMRSDELAAVIPEIKGFSHKTTVLVREGIRKFRIWYKPLKHMLKVNGSLPKPKAVNTTGKLSHLNISFTTYRDKDQEKKVIEHGASVIPFGSKTDILLYSPTGKASTKVTKAGTKAMTWDQFVTKFGI
jgi:DNA ligase (NAD+)